MEISERLIKYNKKQIDFILAMLETGNISKSCKLAKITETTGFKYLKSGINEEINNIRKMYIEESLKKLEYASVKAVDVIIEILENKKCPNSIKLNASKTVLDYSLRIREQTEIIDKLNNIEKAIGEEDEKEQNFK